MADAALGYKEDAIREGQSRCRAFAGQQKMPSKARLFDPNIWLLIYAWTGEKNLAFEQLTVAAKLPGFPKLW